MGTLARRVLTAGVAALLLGVALPRPRPSPATTPPVERLEGTGLWNRILCAGCIALLVGTAAELTPLAVYEAAMLMPGVFEGCALQCVIATT